ncbi:VOC family protein [Arthrobacter alpinus]|uniref:VOC family protein n=1 Tax=Arthrobacter alpinus TaxID=656366 RepID=UPI0016440257|nr:VOC family protein [Arthrobacter alpinus]
MPALPHIDHLALTVTDISVSTAFYSRLWNTEPTGHMTDGPFIRRIFPLANGLTLGLTQHDIGSAKAFDGKNPGLDHIGFEVHDRKTLLEWRGHHGEIGVEHTGLIEAAYGTALSLKDPDGIALEIFIPAD